MRVSVVEVAASSGVISAVDLRVERRAGVRFVGDTSIVGDGGVDVLVGDEDFEVLVSLVGDLDGASVGSGKGLGWCRVETILAGNGLQVSMNDTALKCV